MTHEYTLLLGAVVLPGDGEPEAQAIAWAHAAVLAIGSEADVRSISRGDSTFLDAAGGYVIPLDGDGVVRWPPAAHLEVGGLADLAVLDADPRQQESPASAVRAIVRGGHVVQGSLADLEPSHARKE